MTTGKCKISYEAHECSRGTVLLGPDSAHEVFIIGIQTYTLLSVAYDAGKDSFILTASSPGRPQPHCGDLELFSLSLEVPV